MAAVVASSSSVLAQGAPPPQQQQPQQQQPPQQQPQQQGQPPQQGQSQPQQWPQQPPQGWQQPGAPTTGQPGMPGQPASAPMMPNGMGTEASATPPPDDANKKKEPGRGDFDAGGQVRLPNGPDAMGKFATFNWVAFDMKARYFLLDSVTANANIPIAIIHPDTVGAAGGTGGVSPSMIGGITARLDAMLPKMPMMKKTQVGVSLGVGYMREGAMLLSEKDYPMFVGDFKPGFAGALVTKVKLGNAVDFSLVPAWVYQSGTMDSHTAIQVPMSLILKLGDTIATSADLGVFTGDKYSFSGDKGGRIAAGASLTVKIGPILAHAGAGVASLLTGGLYPTISDSIYVDVNAKYVK
ncbi:MAG: hypothetical protein JO257_19210 [Deltaproteobacteria bacterium]|nr:hypothetical protein [Deltaproteobacteria bacterium]